MEENLMQRKRRYLLTPKKELAERCLLIEQELNKLHSIIKEVKSQLDYLETYSSKEDVFEDMKRRLDRIDKIIGSDKECNT